jgi:hypothetical protein
MLGLLTADLPPFGDAFEVFSGVVFWGNAPESALGDDDARPFGHNTAALEVLITLKGYR